MNNKLTKLISEAKALLPHATVEQKIKLYKLLSEAKKQIKSSVIISENLENTDYLAEK